MLVLLYHPVEISDPEIWKLVAESFTNTAVSRSFDVPVHIGAVSTGYTPEEVEAEISAAARQCFADDLVEDAPDFQMTLQARVQKWFAARAGVVDAAPDGRLPVWQKHHLRKDNAYCQRLRAFQCLLAVWRNIDSEDALETALDSLAQMDHDELGLKGDQLEKFLAMSKLNQRLGFLAWYVNEADKQLAKKVHAIELAVHTIPSTLERIRACVKTLVKQITDTDRTVAKEAGMEEGKRKPTSDFIEGSPKVSKSGSPARS